MARTLVVVVVAALGVCASGLANGIAAPLEPTASSPTASAAPPPDAPPLPSPPSSGVVGSGLPPSQPGRTPAHEDGPESSTAAAGATDTEDPRTRDAREAFRSGTTLARQGRWSDALEAFERSASLRSHPVTSYDVGYCERALGHYTRAERSFRVALGEHEAAREGRMSEPMVAEARKYLAEVTAKLARLRVTLVPPDAAIAVDGRPLEKAAHTGAVPAFIAGVRDAGMPEPTGLESFDIVVDPGTHVFAVRSTRGGEATVTRQTPPGSTVSLTLRVGVADPVAATPRPAIWTYAAFGLGATGLATAAAFGTAAFVKRSHLDDVCGSPPRCPADAAPDIDTAKTYATVASVGLAVGAGGAALGTYLVLTGGNGGERPQDAHPPSTEVAVRPWLGIGSVGATGSF